MAGMQFTLTPGYPNGAFKRDLALYRAGKELTRSLQFTNIEGLSGFMKRNNIGTLYHRLTGESIIFSVHGCLSCSRMKPSGHRICFFEAGMIAGALESIYGREVTVREVKCTSEGFQACEFEAMRIS
jgi:hypothetical protein